MKQYFAKYLPVEGEIKEGDMYLQTLFSDDSNPLLTKHDGISHIGKTDKKVKLFLCSRDIQVGDSFLFRLSYGNYQEKWCEFRIESEDDTHYHCSTKDPVVTPLGPNQSFHKSCLPIDDPKSIVKVIGKISPKATWVKEGMEFDEEEIKIIYANQYKCLCEKPNVYRTPEQANCEHMKDDYRGGDFCDRKIQVVDYIKILCPTCKTFH